MNEKAQSGMIQPRFGRYGICGYDVIVKGLECILFRTKKLARKWMEAHGYEIVGD